MARASGKAGVLNLSSPRGSTQQDGDSTPPLTGTTCPSSVTAASPMSHRPSADVCPTWATSVSTRSQACTSRTPLRGLSKCHSAAERRDGNGALVTYAGTLPSGVGLLRKLPGRVLPGAGVPTSGTAASPQDHHRRRTTYADTRRGACARGSPDHHARRPAVSSALVPPLARPAGTPCGRGSGAISAAQRGWWAKPRKASRAVVCISAHQSVRFTFCRRHFSPEISLCSGAPVRHRCYCSARLLCFRRGGNAEGYDCEIVSRQGFRFHTR